MIPEKLDLTNKRDAHIAERLHKDWIVWLITVREDGRPHAVPVWFLWDGEEILIFSKPEQRKVKNIRTNKQVVLAVDNTAAGNDPIAIEGEATLIDDPNISTSLPAYLEKYGTEMEKIGMPGEKMAQIYTQAIRVKPMRFI